MLVVIRVTRGFEHLTNLKWYTDLIYATSSFELHRLPQVTNVMQLKGTVIFIISFGYLLQSNYVILKKYQPRQYLIRQENYPQKSLCDNNSNAVEKVKKYGIGIFVDVILLKNINPDNFFKTNKIGSNNTRRLLQKKFFVIMVVILK